MEVIAEKWFVQCVYFETPLVSKFQIEIISFWFARLVCVIQYSWDDVSQVWNWFLKWAMVSSFQKENHRTTVTGFREKCDWENFKNKNKTASVAELPPSTRNTINSSRHDPPLWGVYMQESAQPRKHLVLPFRCLLVASRTQWSLGFTSPCCSIVAVSGNFLWSECAFFISLTVCTSSVSSFLSFFWMNWIFSPSHKMHRCITVQYTSPYNSIQRHSQLQQQPTAKSKLEEQPLQYHYHPYQILQPTTWIIATTLFLTPLKKTWSEPNDSGLVRGSAPPNLAHVEDKWKVVFDGWPLPIYKVTQERNWMAR